jgi:hypothetical protein
LPKTRQTPYTEISFRVKPKPEYRKVMKPSHADTLHLADMYMHGIDDDVFKKLWGSSLARVASILGHKPNLKSAAKTTYAIPLYLNYKT